MSQSTPIADLSYRNYDGPLDPPRMRWWVIARQSILLAFKKRSLWVLSALSGWYYLTMIIILFFVQQISAGSPNGSQMQKAFFSRLVWKDQFLHGFSFAQLLILIIALLIGAGAISNDNRANALLVYLSKPCTKADYMFGKWVGVFLPILLVTAIPTLTFYAYGALSLRTEGFIKDDPWLLLRMLSVLPISAALHTSLVLAVSSLFKQGRVAGATYAGLYFFSTFFTVLMKGIWFASRGEASPIVKTLFYCSIDGVQIGLAKAILRTDGTPPFGVQMPSSGLAIPAPPLAPCLLIVGLLTAASMLLIANRVRAVEVVG